MNQIELESYQVRWTNGVEDAQVLVDDVWVDLPTSFDNDTGINVDECDLQNYITNN